MPIISVEIMKIIDERERSLFTVRLRIVLLFAILTVTPVISESQLGNRNSPKVSGHLFIIN